MSTVTYTEPRFVVDVRVTAVPTSPVTTAYGAKIPSRYMINYLGRWRRVYVMQYANSGSAYVIVGGEDVFLDSDTEHLLEAAS